MLRTRIIYQGSKSFRSFSQPSALLLAAAFALILLCAAPGSATALKCDKPPETPPSARTQPGNLGILKLRLTRYACSGAYDKDVERVLRRAQAHVERRAGRVAKPALVLDIDETALSNWQAIQANDFGYIPGGKCESLPRGPCGWHDWEHIARAEAIAPTLALFNAAKSKQVAVFFITGRRGDPDARAGTEKNLRQVGYDGWNELIMRSAEASKLTAKVYKSAERAKIVAKGYTIIANVGDQISDLAGGYSQRTFLIPNPFYYIK